MQDDGWSYNQPVDGDEKVFMRLVDYDLADGQLAHAAGGTPRLEPSVWRKTNRFGGKRNIRWTVYNGTERRSKLMRQLGLPLRGVWALASSELPWAVPDGPT